MKDLIASKTIIGLVIAMLGPVAARYGIEAGELQSAIELAAELVGSGLAIYGRIKADKPITSVAGIKIGGQS